MAGNGLNYLTKSTFAHSELAQPESSIRKKSAADPARTGDSANLKARQRVAVDLDAKTGAIGHAYDAAGMFDRRDQKRLPDRVFGAVELQHWLEGRKGGRRVRRQNGQKLQRCSDGNSGAPDMRIVANTESLSHVGDLLA